MDDNSEPDVVYCGESCRKKACDQRCNGDSVDGHTTTDTSSSFSGPDGGWGWLVVVAAFLNHVIFDGSMYSCGVFYVEFLDYFKAGKVETTWIASTTSGLSFLMGPIAGMVINTWGCRVAAIAGAGLSSVGFVLSIFATNVYILYVTLGALSGVGFCFMYTSSLVCIAWYFEKRRSFATGLAVCGAGVGAFIMAPLTQWLIDTYAWKGAILILGGIVANGIVCGTVFAPLTKAKQKHEDKSVECRQQNGVASDVGSNGSWDQEDQTMETRTDHQTVSFTSNMSVVFGSVVVLPNSYNPENSAWCCKSTKMDLSMLKDRAFILWGVSEMLSTLSFMTPFIFLPSYAVSLGISLQDAAFLISVIGITNTISRVLIGFVCDLKPVVPYRMHVYASLYVVSGVVIGVIGLCESYTTLLVCAVLHGATLGRVSLGMPLLVDLFTLDRFVKIMGLQNVVIGLMSLVGSPFTGWIFQLTGSYAIMFLTGGLIMAASGVAKFMIQVVRR